jgi:ABC-type transport system involved in cytochrome c biogenesis permease subunit
VASDNGLYVVYGGFTLMTLGVFWVFWWRPPVGDEVMETGPLSSDQLTYRLVCLGFPLLTLGLVLGAVWGKLVWTDYWHWDPKELLSLATWLVFLAYVHWRYSHAGRFPRISAALAILGLVAVVVTLLWVTLSGVSRLHSYASSRSGLSLKEGWLGGLTMGALAAYALAAAAAALRKRKIVTPLFAGGFVLALAGVLVRWFEVGHLPLQNLFEVFLFMGMLAFPLSLVYRFYLRSQDQALDALLGFLLLFPAAFIFPADAERLPPPLRTWLFGPHVLAYMLAYVILAKAGLLALGRLLGVAARRAE